jgi:hypothetical protein
MYKFNYVTMSANGKSNSVSSDFVTKRLIGKNMVGIGTADSGRFINFSLSDGSHVKFILGEKDAEIQYHAPEN